MVELVRGAAANLSVKLWILGLLVVFVLSHLFRIPGNPRAATGRSCGRIFCILSSDDNLRTLGALVIRDIAERRVAVNTRAPTIIMLQAGCAGGVSSDKVHD
jgi:hypothetical protein